MKCSKQTKLRPLLRLLAVGTVFVWVAASEFCALETLMGHTHEGSSSGHAAEQASSAQHNSAPPQDPDGDHHSEDSCCSTLQTAELAMSSVVSIKPDFSEIGVLLPTWPAEFSTPSEHQQIFSRQPWERRWVFTPEVCLGPAFRSHAPPSFA